LLYISPIATWIPCHNHHNYSILQATILYLIIQPHPVYIPPFPYIVPNLLRIDPYLSIELKPGPCNIGYTYLPLSTSRGCKYFFPRRLSGTAIAPSIYLQTQHTLRIILPKFTTNLWVYDHNLGLRVELALFTFLMILLEGGNGRDKG